MGEEQQIRRLQHILNPYAPFDRQVQQVAERIAKDIVANSIEEGWINDASKMVTIEWRTDLIVTS